MIDEIRRKLNYLRETVDFSPLDRQSGNRLEFSRTKGSNHLLFVQGHRFRIGPTLSEKQIKKTEQKYRIELPEGYRAFLLEVGNGGIDGHRGPGPGYDLYSLSKSLQGIKRDVITKPFPYQHRWIEPDEEDFENAEAYFEEMDRSYHVQGIMYIAYHGCTVYDFLVITGEERGNVWVDDRGAFEGLWPYIVRDGQVTARYKDDDRTSPHVNFLTWYDAWLDEQIEFFNEVYSSTTEDEEGPAISFFTTRE